MAIQYLDLVNGEDKTWTHAITGATRANPCVLTLTAHPFQVGDVVYISGVVGMTQLNLNTYTITAIATNTVTLNVDASAFSAYTSGGTVTLYRRIITGVTQANPAVVTCPAHGFTNGQQVYFTGVGGMTQLNGNVYTVANAATNTFELSGIDSTGYSAYTTGGSVARPYLTFAWAFGNTANRVTTGDILRVAKTPAATTHSLGNCTWTIGSATVTTTVDYSGVVNVGDMIGIPTAAGNGADESFYRVVSRTSSQIVLAGFYGGPATVTVGGIKVLAAPVATGPNPGYACAITVGCTVSGGWTLSATPTQNGETWIKPTGARTGSQNIGIGILTSGITITHMNTSDSYYGLTGAGTGSTISNCSFLNGYVYTVYALAVNYAMTNVRVGHNDGPSWFAFYPGATHSTLTGVVVTGYATATSQAVRTVTGNNDYSGLTVRGAGYGINVGTNMRLYGATIFKCNYGVIIDGSSQSCVIENCTISQSATTGINSNSQSQGVLIKGCTIDQCGSAITLGQMHGIRIEDNIFSNSVNYDITTDVYSGQIYCYGNSHLTPGIRAFNRSSSTGTIYIVNSTIDAGSILKTFATTTTENAIIPQFAVQDSFFGITGQYFGRYEIVKNTGTTPPSVQLKFNTTVTNFYYDQKVASTYAKTGVAKTLTFKLTSVSAGWSGTLVPKIKLNGETIQTETTITSVSYGSDDTYTYNVPGGSITSDGELSIEFLANANTVAILVKEFTVT